ncbi:MAG: ATPase domain-containing protein [Candidatus Micrarchaeaceae archaeon]
MEKIERVSTGIDGLDQLVEGGIPAMDQVVIAGGPGSGKTLMSMEILYHAAKKGMHAAFIALEENPKVVLSNFKSAFPAFADVEELVEDGTFLVGGEDAATRIQSTSDSESYSFGNIVSDIETIVGSNSAKLIAIDSISLIKLLISDKLLYRRSMIALTANLRRLGVTSLLTAEMVSSERKDLRYSQEFFIFDGIVAMYQMEQEDRRSLGIEIVKMRGSAHSWSLVPYEITPEGFKVYSVQ